MKSNEIRNLLNMDLNPFVENKITQKELFQLDSSIINYSEHISNETFGIYKKFVVMKQEAPNSMKIALFNTIKNYISEKISEKQYADALFMQRFLVVKSFVSPQTYYDIAEILFRLKEIDSAKAFVKVYQKKETNLPLKLLTLGNYYNILQNDYKTAIKFYEQYIKIDSTKAVIFNILGNLYKKAYGDSSINEQIYYYEKAHLLKPDDRLSLHCLAFGYEHLKNKDLADKYYKKLLENTPTPTDYYNYGGFLISNGDLKNGHKYLTHRFEINDNNLKYPKTLDINKKWNFKDDISNKTLLIHYEQGFGDTFMYSRFIPEMKKLARKVIFIVQKEVFEVIKSSPLISDGIELLPDNIDFSNIVYDYNMLLLDCPFVLNTTVDSIPYSQGYLMVPEEKIQEYSQKYLNSENHFKVGISYQGNKSANYKGRDIDFCKFTNLLELKNFDFYSFNMDSSNETGNITNLSKTFNSFEETACAIKNMDFMVSTDNVILNLAGGLGVKTFGLFNEYPNFRWFKLKGENVGWYDSVKPLQAENEDNWLPVISEVINLLKENS